MLSTGARRDHGQTNRIMSLLKQAILVAVTAVAVIYLPSFFKKSLPIPEVKGYVAPGFENVKDVFRQNFELGWDKKEGGSAFAAYYEGKKVVDIWAGYSDHEAGIPWKEDTLGIIYSTSKAVAALCIGMLAERDLIDFKKPVAYYWPEFAKHGKENITVEMVLEHEAGLPVVSKQLTWELLSNLDELDEVLADSTPMWEPGTKHGYHALSYGFLVNAIVRRVDPKGRTVGQFLQEEIAAPHGIDIYIGVPKELSHRVVRVVPVTETIFDLIHAMYHYPSMLGFFFNSITSFGDTPFAKIIENSGETVDFGRLCDADIRKIEMPAANGFATAEGLAKLFGILANGGTSLENNKTILSKKFLENYENHKKEPTEDFVIYPAMIVWKWGMALEQWEQGGKNAYGHPGSGGQMGQADPERKLGFGFIGRYMISAIGNDERYLRVRAATYEAVKALKKS